MKSHSLDCVFPIHSWIQRNEAQRLLLIEHENGKTNLEAVLNIIDVERIFDKIVEVAKAFGVSFENMADALKEITRRTLHENPGD